VTVIQRFGSGLQLNVDAHALGARWRVHGSRRRHAAGFHPAAVPSDAKVARLVATIHMRGCGCCGGAEWVSEAEDDDARDPFAEASLALAGITSVAVQDRSALGPRAGARVLQIGRVPGTPWVTSTGIC
jgi:hypothetical protein